MRTRILSSHLTEFWIYCTKRWTRFIRRIRMMTVLKMVKVMDCEIATGHIKLSALKSSIDKYYLSIYLYMYEFINFIIKTIKCHRDVHSSDLSRASIIIFSSQRFTTENSTQYSISHFSLFYVSREREREHQSLFFWQLYISGIFI